MLYRFELAFDGVPQDVGFLHGLGDVGLETHECRVLYDMFEDLPSPPLNFRESGSFWFTEYGLETFADAIRKVGEALGPHGWELMQYSLHLPPETVELAAQYRDYYQIALPLQYTVNKVLMGPFNVVAPPTI